MNTSMRKENIIKIDRYSKISNFYFYYDHKKESDRKFLFAKKMFRQLFDGLFELTILYSKKEYVFSSN